jgi:hypothetical protein
MTNGTSTATPLTQTVTRYWKTGVIITQADVAGILGADPAGTGPAGQGRCLTVSPDSVPGLPTLREQFLDSMNALAAAENAAEVTCCDLEIQVWRNGYDQPAFSCQARYAGWTILAASPAPRHSESGCLAFADPRAGSAGTAMPGLPWGRQFIITPLPGNHTVVPGWLTCSVVPLECGQHITVAVALSTG